MSENKTAMLANNEGQPVGLRGNMGTFTLVMSVLAFSAPLSTATGFISVLLGLSGTDGGAGNSAPLIYVMNILILVFFAIGFSKMGTIMKRPGGFYAFITDGLGRKAGLTAAMVSAIGYALVGFFMPGLMALTFNTLIVNLGGPEMNWIVLAIIFAALSTVLAMMKIDVSAKILFFVMVLEVIIIVIFDILSFVNGAGPSAGGATVNFFDFASGTFGVAILYSMGNFYGFEATVIYREECKDPDHTIPRAMFIAVIGIGVFYLFTAWGFISYFGANNVTAEANADPTNLFFNVVNGLLGPVVVDVVNIIACFSIFASGLAIHNTSARYWYSLGVDGVMPKVLAKVHPKQYSPYIAALCVGLFWILLIVVIGLIGGQTAEWTYSRPNVIGNLFVTFILCVVSIAVFVYMRQHKDKANIWQTTIGPIIGIVGIGFVVVMCAFNLNGFLGTTAVGTSVVLAIFFAYIIGSYIYACWLEKNKPDVYARIGRNDPDSMSVEEIK